MKNIYIIYRYNILYICIYVYIRFQIGRLPIPDNPFRSSLRTQHSKQNKHLFYLRTEKGRLTGARSLEFCTSARSLEFCTSAWSLEFSWSARVFGPWNSIIQLWCPVPGILLTTNSVWSLELYRSALVPIPWNCNYRNVMVPDPWSSKTGYGARFLEFYF